MKIALDQEMIELIILKSFKINVSDNLFGKEIKRCSVYFTEEDGVQASLILNDESEE